MQTDTTVTGVVVDVFAHRFVVETASGRILADLGPRGAAALSLHRGDAVQLTGEMKPSELKVHRIVRGETRIDVEHGKPHDHSPAEHSPADPAPALETVRANGFTPIGAPRRKPKHFEILGRDGAGDLLELHVSLDGQLRKAKPTRATDAKWSAGFATQT